jgi:hypothetical protein
MERFSIELGPDRGSRGSLNMRLPPWVTGREIAPAHKHTTKPGVTTSAKGCRLCCQPLVLVAYLVMDVPCLPLRSPISHVAQLAPSLVHAAPLHIAYRQGPHVTTKGHKASGQ